MLQLLALAIALVAMPCLAAAPAGKAPSAGPLQKLDTAMKLAPADAAFYASVLRNREQIAAIGHSHAWAKIRQMPIVQMGLSLYAAQASVPDSYPARFDAMLQNPEVRKILALATDMVSDEVFVFGDKDCVEFMGLLQDVNVATSYGPMLLQATGQAQDLRSQSASVGDGHLGVGRARRADQVSRVAPRLQAEKYRAGQRRTGQAGNDRQHRAGEHGPDQGPLQEDEDRQS